MDEIFVTFETEELEKTLVAIGDWCDYGDDLHNVLRKEGLDQSDLYEQFKYMMEVREIALKG